MRQINYHYLYKKIRIKQPWTSSPKTSGTKNIGSIHSANTEPEMIVRKYLFAHGFRYRLNHPRLPGRPDIVLRKYRTCIFINGCFWHGHEGCKYYVIPKSNTEFWTRKITRNIERDKQVQQELARMGWHCMTIWECELKPQKREQTLLALEYTLNHIYLKDHTVSYSFDEEEKPLMCGRIRRYLSYPEQ